MVIAVMIYGSPCWNPNVENLKVLEDVQKKCVKLILLISLYLQLQDRLLLDKCINCAYDFDGSN